MSDPRPPTPSSITRDDVVECALALVESGGAGALTMRKLAAELGVSVTSVYWHVGGRDEVVLAVIERSSERLAQRPVTGDDPAARIMSAARHVWDSALEHPEVMRLAHSVGATSLLELPLEIALARELNHAGLSGETARDALRSILICVGGFLVLALRPPDAVPADRAGTALWAEARAPGVDAATQAALSQPVDLDALFERTVRTVVQSYLRA